MFRWAQLQHVDTLTDIQRAARFYYLQKLAFGAKVTGQTFGTGVTVGPRLNLLRIEEELSHAHLRLARVTIEHLPWQGCMERYDRPETLFYLDPPYYQTIGYGPDFGLDQHQQLAEAMASLQGKAILSINDHPAMREVYGAFRRRRLSTTYTVGQHSGRAKPASELLITTW
jgi:DNA adenine methylase